MRIYTCRKFDALIAMADTLSYVYPEQRLSNFLYHAKSVLRNCGIFIIDVGLWAGYLDESRSEKWASEIDCQITNASYDASISQVHEGDRIARRVETLSFEVRQSGLILKSTQQREILSFSYNVLIDYLSIHGFKFSHALEPGKLDTINFDRLQPKRALFAFINT